MSTTSKHNTVLDRVTSELVVIPWRDPIVERVGFDACGDYVELFWLSTLGPTATWLLRRLAVTVVNNPDGFAIDLAATAASLGLGYESGRANPFARAVQRLVMFGLAQPVGDRLAIRSVVPPLAMKQLARLPEHLQRAHAQWAESDPELALVEGYSGGRTVNQPTISDSLLAS